METKSKIGFAEKGTSQRGQSLVEIALMLPLLLLLLLGVIVVGRYAYQGILVGNAARAGAAYGAEQLGNAAAPYTGIVQAAQNDYLNNGQSSLLNVTVTVTCGCDIGGTVSPDTSAACFPSSPPTCAGHWVNTVRVSATATFSSFFNFPGIPGSITVARTSTMRIANK